MMRVSYLLFVYYLCLLYLICECYGQDDKIYDPSKSKTYDKRWIEYFYYDQETESYLGGAAYTGYNCKDKLALGPSYDSTSPATVDFLCISSSGDALPFDGIMGMGPDSNVLSNVVPSKQFAIFLAPNVGELQMGGYIPSSIVAGATINYTTSLKGTHYGYHVQIDYIRLTDGVTNNFVYTAPPEGTTVSYPMETIADSGTGRVMLPTLINSATAPNLPISLYDTVKNWTDARPLTEVFHLYFSVGGVEYDTIITPGSFGRLMNDYASTLILGQPFFFYNLVAHDVTDAAAPKIGFAKKNQNYIPNTQSYPGVKTVPLNTSAHDAESYFLTIQVGTPPVYLDVMVDTGSGDLLVQSTKHFSIPIWFYVMLGVFCVLILAVTCRYLCKTRKPKVLSKQQVEQLDQKVRLLIEEETNL